MKQIIADVLDFKVPTLIYESVEEADKAAGQAGAALDQCNKNLQYRGSNADARELIVAIAEELSGEPRKTKKVQKGDKEVSVPAETEADYVNRVIGLKKVTRDDIQALVTDRATNGYSYTEDGETKNVPPVQVDIKERARTPKGPTKLAEVYKTSATKLLAGADDKKITATLNKFLKDVSFTRTGDAAKDVDVLGRLIKSYQAAKLEAGVL